MADDRLFELLRGLGPPIDPEPAFAERLLESLLSEAALGPSGAVGNRSRPWRIGPFRLPRPGLRLVLVLLILLALVSVSVAVGTWLLRTSEGFVETPVALVDVPAPSGWSLDPLLLEGDVGGSASLAQGSDGAGVVAFTVTSAREASTHLSVAKCLDSSCSSVGTPVDVGPVDPMLIPQAGGYLAVGSADSVWVAWPLESRIRLERLCPGPLAGACEPSEPMDIGAGSSAVVRVRPDGRPVVLFGSGLVSPSSLLLCGDAACQTQSLTTTVPVSMSDVDVELDPDGRPVIANGHGGGMELVSCLDDACAQVSVTSVGPGRQPQLALDSAGRPVIAAFAERSVVLYRCADVGCAGGAWSTLADLGAPPVGTDEQLSLDLRLSPADGAAWVTLGAGGNLQLVACSTSTCDDAVRIALDATSPALAAPLALGVDADGLPIVIYGVRSDLKVARCLELGCLSPGPAGSPLPGGSAGVSPTASSSSNGATIDIVGTLVDPAAGYNPAVVVGADGVPVAVYSVDDGSVHVLHCEDARCEAGSTVSTPLSGTVMGTAVAIAPDGRPVLAFADWDGAMSIARCVDIACSEASAVHLLDGAWPEFATILVPSDDRPVVAFMTESAGIRLNRCVNPSCSSSQQAVIDPNPDGWWVNSLELRPGPNNALLIGYALANGETRIARCADLDCTATSVTTVGTAATEDVTATLGIGPDGVPLLAFYSDGSLMVARCEDETCSAVTTTRVDAATAGWWSPIGIGFDQHGLPTIAYFSPTNLDTKIARCLDVSCTNVALFGAPASDANGADDQTGIAFFTDGSPIFIYAREAGVFAEGCADPGCGG